MQVSVIIPTYNRAGVLSRALESVMAQTLPAEEVIVVDDGSTDHTAEVAARFPEVRYVYQDNHGVSHARNRGIGMARSPWIALLDSDDEWLPEKLERQHQQVQQNPGHKIIHTEEIWIRNGKRVNAMNKHQKHGGDIFEQCLPLCVISPSSVIIHRDVFDEVGLFDETLPACEDYDLWLRLCARYPVLFVEEPSIVKHGGHEDQLSRKYWGMDRFRIRALEKILQDDEVSNAHKQAAYAMLREKIDIFILGARKRQKWDDIADYEKLKERYRHYA